MAKIYGTKFGGLLEGYTVNINDASIKSFTVNEAAPEAGIKPGALLITTSTPQSYTTPTTLSTVANLTGKVAGVAVATNVKLNTVFPQGSDGDNFKRGEQGTVIIRGEIAVALTGATPAENAKVYYNPTELAFTATSTSNLEIPNAIFTGVVDGDLAVIRIG